MSTKTDINLSLFSTSTVKSILENILDLILINKKVLNNY
jgi:hypothetical protein